MASGHEQRGPGRGVSALLCVVVSCAAPATRAPEPAPPPPPPPEASHDVPREAAQASAQSSSAPPLDPPSPSLPSPLAKRLDAWRQFLERDAISVAEIAAAIDADASPVDTLERSTLRPRGTELASASVSLYPASASKPVAGAVYLLNVVFAPASQPTLDALDGLFGAHRRAPALHGERVVLYYPTPAAATGRRWSVAVIASASRCHDPHSTAEVVVPCDAITGRTRVEKVTFRRDPDASP